VPEYVHLSIVHGVLEALGQIEAMLVLEEKVGSAEKLPGVHTGSIGQYRRVIMRGDFTLAEEMLIGIKESLGESTLNSMLAQIKTQRILEILSGNSLNVGGAGNAIKEVRILLKEFEGMVSREEFLQVNKLLGLRSVNDHERYTHWTVPTGRFNLFSTLLPSLQPIFPNQPVDKTDYVQMYAEMAEKYFHGKREMGREPIVTISSPGGGQVRVAGHEQSSLAQTQVYAAEGIEQRVDRSSYAQPPQQSHQQSQHSVAVSSPSTKIFPLAAIPKAQMISQITNLRVSQLDSASALINPSTLGEEAGEEKYGYRGHGATFGRGAGREGEEERNEVREGASVVNPSGMQSGVSGIPVPVDMKKMPSYPNFGESSQANEQKTAGQQSKALFKINKNETGAQSPANPFKPTQAFGGKDTLTSPSQLVNQSDLSSISHSAKPRQAPPRPLPVPPQGRSQLTENSRYGAGIVGGVDRDKTVKMDESKSVFEVPESSQAEPMLRSKKSGQQGASVHEESRGYKSMIGGKEVGNVGVDQSTGSRRGLLGGPYEPVSKSSIR